MSRHLPPLNALRAFEAAARHLSFTRAADELNVTQAAVSHQVKALEERLGVALFRRTNRALRLTEVGERYLPEVRAAFDRLAEATARLSEGDDSGVLTVSVLPSLAAQWLVPRLARFRTLHPEIDVRIHAADALVDFVRDDVDVAIRYGRGAWEGLMADKLFSEDFFPVCSPELAARLQRPEDLQLVTLLHEAGTQVDWSMWLRAHDIRSVNAARGPSFSHGNMVLAAAIAGHGVALGRTPLVNDDLQTGRLVRPFDGSLPGAWAHYIVYPASQSERPKTVAFRNWLIEEATALPTR